MDSLAELARLLSPFQDGSDPRNPETTGKLQVLQRLKIPSATKGSTNLSNKDGPVYVRMDFRTPMVEDEKAEKENTDEIREKSVKKNKNCGRKN